MPAALHQTRRRDRDAHEVGIDATEVLQHSRAHGGIGVRLRLCQAASHRPAGHLVTGGFQTAGPDVGGFLGSVADFQCIEAKAEELHGHDAGREQKGDDHGELRTRLPTLAHEASIGPACCVGRYVSSRSIPDGVTRLSNSRRGGADAATRKAAATRAVTC